ncbi:MAG: transferase hexapeptide repeat containing protein [Pedosphaera sp.]|nr:transferase hexapeptide repeat containing protein [Pedosphaera sp.]
MSSTQHSPINGWPCGTLPLNVVIGANSLITGELAFKRFHSQLEKALVIGAHCTMDGVHFDLGKDGRLVVGDYCYFTNAVLLCELEVRVGNYVVIGWNTTITDTDFHPLGPAERIADAMACSPLGKGRPRPKVLTKPVIIEDNVWIGPNATILKGVCIGAGAFVEAGSLVTRDVPARARVLGNPAQVIGEVS